MARVRPTLLPLVFAAAVVLLLAGPAAAAQSHHRAPQKPSGTGTGTGTGTKPPLAHLAIDTGLAFSGSGFLAVFHLGALRALRELGLATQATRVAGTSGGALMSGLSCLGVAQKDAWEIAESINKRCLGNWDCAGKLDGAVRTAIRSAVDTGLLAAGLSDRAPQAERDAFVRRQCAGVATFNMSKIDPTLPLAQAIKTATSWPISDFTNETDFTGAGEASAYVPVMSGKAHTEFRGAAVIDGMFSSGLPPRCVAKVRDCVSIKAVTKDAGAEADISPGKYSALPDGLTPESWQRHAMLAPSDKLARDMEQHGYEQAVAWACEAHPRSMAATGKCGGKKASSAKKGPFSSSSSWQPLPRKIMLPSLPPQWQVPALG